MLPAANAANESAPLYRGWKRILPVSRSPRSRARSRARALPGLPAFPGQGPGASVAAAPAPPRCPAQGFWATVRQGSSVPLPCLPPCFLQERVHPPALLLRAVLWHLLQMGCPRDAEQMEAQTTAGKYPSPFWDHADPGRPARQGTVWEPRRPAPGSPPGAAGTGSDARSPGAQRPASPGTAPPFPQEGAPQGSARPLSSRGSAFHRAGRRWGKQKHVLGSS
uniref:sterile alpha motif domain-containing protein 1-like isoform X3 n=1 Tax=Nyctereutes procyonoides TaxID=34880 RepID=UPI002443CC84|nr:sterile alpha motif domain-containing protein 1-like isoform X3 [Nyctereutes procyonoides]